MVLLHRGSQEGYVYLRRRERLPGGDRAGALPASRRAAMRGRRRAGRALGRGGGGVRRAEAGRACQRGRSTRVLAGLPGALQSAEVGCLLRRAADLGSGKNPQAGAARAAYGGAFNRRYKPVGRLIRKEAADGETHGSDSRVRTLAVAHDLSRTIQGYGYLKELVSCVNGQF